MKILDPKKKPNSCKNKNISVRIKNMYYHIHKYHNTLYYLYFTGTKKVMFIHNWVQVKLSHNLR